MVTYGAGPVYPAISDPTRRAILDLLRDGERSAGDIAREIAGEFPVSRPAVSRHLRVLRRAGLVQVRPVAQARRYSLVAEPLREVQRWLDGYRVRRAARLQP